MDTTDYLFHSATTSTTSAEKIDSNWNQSDLMKSWNISTIPSNDISTVGLIAYGTYDFGIIASSYYLIISIIGVVILSGNVLTLAAVVTTPKIRQKSYVMMTSLAVTDVFCGLVTINYAVHELLAYPTCALSTFRSIMRPVERLVPHSSFMHIAAIAIDRYVAVVYPLDYELRMTSSKLGLMITGVWLTAVCLSFPPYLAFSELTPNGWGTSCIKTEWPIFDSVGNLVNYVINSTVVVAVYRKMWSIAMQHEQLLQNQRAPVILPTTQSSVTKNGSRVSTETHVKENVETDRNVFPLQSRSNSGSVTADNSATSDAGGNGMPAKCGPRIVAVVRRAFGRKLSSRHRATRTVMALIVSYVVLWFPYNVGNFLIICNLLPTISFSLQAIGVIAGFINVALNVIVYVIFNRDFRSAFRRIFCFGSKNSVQPSL